MVELALPLFPGTRFILADSSEDMLLRAKERLKAAPRHRVRFLPPVRSERLLFYNRDIRPQVTTAVFCHHYLKTRERLDAVRSIYQMLTNHGLFITFENIHPFSSDGVRIGLERWKQYQMRQGRPLSMVEAHIQRFNTKYFPITVDNHLNLLRTAGFQTVEMLWFSQMQAGFYAIKK